MLKPIAVALDKLRAEECFYGCLIPTLLVTQQLLSPEENHDLRLNHCMPLLAAVLSGFNGTFVKYLSLGPEITDTVMTTVTHPYFKLRRVTLLKGPNFVNQEILKINYKNEDKL